MPTNTQPAADPRHYLLSTIRESQAAVIETIRAWTAINEQVTRNLRPRLPDVDLAGVVDRAFDIAEQTLAAQHQLARALAGLTSRQLDTAVETADATVEVVETTIREGAERAEGLVEAATAPPQVAEAAAALPQVAKDETAKAEEARQDRRSSEDRKPAKANEANKASANAVRSQPSKPARKRDRRPYEERSVEELRERAGELEIEGRSSMGKDELIAALRQQSR